ncbi:MAG TPA: hypothetical protein VNU49_09115 [Opitutaceae bacterium]|nr:hypothetical protein [Opitutaceae bacterium]
MDENDLANLKGVNAAGDQDVPFRPEKENRLFETGRWPQASPLMVIGLVLLSGRNIVLKGSGGPLRGKRPASFLNGKVFVPSAADVTISILSDSIIDKWREACSVANKISTIDGTPERGHNS